MKLYKVLFESSFSYARPQPPDDVNDKNISNQSNEKGLYCTGLCAEFAVALNKTFGYDLAAFMQTEYDSDYDQNYYTLVHAFAKHPSDETLGIDAQGIRPIEEIKQDLFVSSKGQIKMVRTSEKDLDEQGLEGLDAQAVDDAIRYIRIHRGHYEAD